MLFRIFSLIALTAIVAVACSGSATPTAEPTSMPASETSHIPPQAVYGTGEATAAPFVTHSLLEGGTKNVPSFGDAPFEDTVGNRFTFAIIATRDENGNVEGSMRIVDLDGGLVIEGDVAVLKVRELRGPPVGLEGIAYHIDSSLESVVVNGEPKPGWRFRYSPVYDGGPGFASDTVCIGLYDETDTKLVQWSAFLSSGNLHVVP